MTLPPHLTQSQEDPGECGWCWGTGARLYRWAYVRGPAPLSGDEEAVTAQRPGACTRCGGSGRYRAAGDPALEHLRDRGPSDS